MVVLDLEEAGTLRKCQEEQGPIRSPVKHLETVSRLLSQPGPFQNVLRGWEWFPGPGNSFLLSVIDISFYLLEDVRDKGKKTETTFIEFVQCVCFLLSFYNVSGSVVATIHRLSGSMTSITQWK